MSNTPTLTVTPTHNPEVYNKAYSAAIKEVRAEALQFLQKKYVSLASELSRSLENIISSDENGMPVVKEQDLQSPEWQKKKEEIAPKQRVIEIFMTALQNDDKALALDPMLSNLHDKNIGLLDFNHHKAESPEELAARAKANGISPENPLHDFPRRIYAPLTISTTVQTPQTLQIGG